MEAKTANGVAAEAEEMEAKTANGVAEITNGVAAEADEKEEIEEPVHKRQKLEHSCNNNNNHNGNHNGSLSSLTATTAAAVAVLEIKKNSAAAVVPSRASAFAAGYDLSSDCKCVVPARSKALVQTGISVAIPEGTYGRIAPRSGLAWKHSIDVGAGVIDCDYRGPLGVVLFNHSDQDFHIKVGDRIAQLIIQSILTPEAIQVDDLDSTVRGNGGFGSTGI